MNSHELLTCKLFPNPDFPTESGVENHFGAIAEVIGLIVFKFETDFEVILRLRFFKLTSYVANVANMGIIPSKVISLITNIASMK